MPRQPPLREWPPQQQPPSSVLSLAPCRPTSSRPFALGLGRPSGARPEARSTRYARRHRPVHRSGTRPGRHGRDGRIPSRRGASLDASSAGFRVRDPSPAVGRRIAQVSEGCGGRRGPAGPGPCGASLRSRCGSRPAVVHCGQRRCRRGARRARAAGQKPYVPIYMMAVAGAWMLYRNRL